MRLVWMLTVAFGCGTKEPSADWDECDDTAAGACDSGRTFEIDPLDDDGGGDDWYGDDGGTTDGGTDAGTTDGGTTDGGTTDGGGSSSSRSCQFGSQICIETSAPDPGAWCAAEGGDSSESACSPDYTSYCIIPPSDNPTYMYAATAYYYDNFDASAACTDVGGTYVG